MASAVVNLLGKRKPEDCLETKPVLRKHKEQYEANVREEGVDETPDFVEDAAVRKKTLFAGCFVRGIQISDIINFFKDVGQVVRIRFLMRKRYGFVEFASSNQAKKALEKKNCGYLRGGIVLLTKVLDETEKNTVGKKTLFVGNLSLRAEISDIINFFKEAGQVVHVRLIVLHNSRLVGCGFVEFASANEAMTVLQKKNGEYFHDSKIFLVVASEGATYLPPKYCIDHRVWYNEDYLEPIKLIEDVKTNFLEDVLLVANLSPHTTKIEQIVGFFKDVGEVVGVRLMVNQENKHFGYCFVEFASAYEANKALEERNGEYLHDHPILLRKGLDESIDSVEAGAVKQKTLGVNNLAPETEISDIIDFFKDVGEVVHVQLAADHSGKHMGYGFVEFASANQAKTALGKKKGEYLHDCEILFYGFGRSQRRLPKYYLDYNVCYEDYLGRESLVLEEDAAAGEELDETPEEVDIRKKTLFFATNQFKINNIIKTFINVGQVVRVRLIVDHWGEHVGCGFIEFASANEANNALEKKNGDSIYLRFAETARYSSRTNYMLEERLWYEENLTRESLYFKTKLNLRKQKKVFCGDKKILGEED